jgi:spoIIIJ-associated protein
LEEEIAVARELMGGLLERMGIGGDIEVLLKEGDIYLQIKGDEEGILIGKHGRTLDSLQMLINRMVNKRLKRAVRVLIDVNEYRRRREESLTNMAIRVGEKAKRMGYALTIGPFNAHDRRIIHLALREDPVLTTESMGEGEVKKMTIRPSREEGGRGRRIE